MLKYGPSGFILEILEYCDPKEVIIREQYYLDLLKPIYNLLEKASSSLGYRHTKEAIEKMKAAHKERELSEETKAKLKKHLVKFNVKEKCFCVEAINIETKVTSTFPYLREAAKAFDTNHNTIRNYVKSGKLFKDIYHFYIKSRGT
jgi:hypothetical protein